MSEPDAPEPDAVDAGQWEPVRRAIDGEHREQPDAMPTLAGVRSALAGAMPLLVDSRFAEMGAVLPALLRDADALVSASPASARMAAKSLRAQARQLAGIRSPRGADC